MGTELVSFYYSASIAINLLCFVLVFASKLNQKQPYLNTIMLGCVLMTIFQFATWSYHEASNLETALTWLRMQIAIILITTPLLYVLFIQWSGERPQRRILYPVLSICIFCLIANIVMPYTLSFSGDVELVSYTVFGNEQVYRLAGSQSAFELARYSVSAFVVCVLIGVAVRLHKREEYVVFGILCSTLTLIVGISVVNAMVDSGKFDLIYFGGLPSTILNVAACLSISISLAAKTASLNKQIALRQQLEEMLANLAEGTSSVDSDRFYVEMMEQLDKVSGASFTYLALYSVEDGKPWIRTKAAFHQHKLIPNFSYPLDTIDNRLFEKDHPTIIKDGLYRDFPDVPLFQKVRATGYINYPIINEVGGIEGSIISLYDHPFEHTSTQEQIMRVLTSRAGAEMRRNRLESELRQMAYFDYQTQLPNITQLHKIIEEQFERNLAAQSQSLLMVLELTKMSELNRQFGFEFVDSAIKVLGERLRDCVDENMKIARFSRDEFAIVIENVKGDPKHLVEQHYSICSQLIQAPIKHSGREIKLYSCAGGVIFPGQTPRKSDVIRCASLALRQAKQEKLAYNAFDKSTLEKADRESRIDILLEQALINENELFVMYQPKVSKEGELKGAEALARWVNQELGFVSPVEFIELAEQNGHIDKLGLLIIRQVCQQLQAWQQEGFDFNGRVAINVSALQLAKPDFVHKTMFILNEYGVIPSQIEFELTESGLLKNLDEGIERLSELRYLGFTIALDDFGTGYSSLSHLKDLPLDVLKIDRAFVSSLDKRTARKLASAIVTIGHHMSMSIVAEGVEQALQIDILHEMGCDVFQGYYFGKPMQAKDFVQWHNNKRLSIKATRNTKSV
ncbi:putative bifunctional diguanylate cyclase/phosphodiesterase [Ningiella sp. W23]|uniref:putative bifunctional diguanylate cyclase/phosphodiesterase n=1 Tax=Ningiella sp. W23 TaxID=3023715 RepID=UPI0037568060